MTAIDTLYMKLNAALQGEGAALPTRTHKLWREGKVKMAKKLIEEAGEVALEAVAADNKTAIIQESADLLYHLTLLLAAHEITPQQVYDEMARRDRLYGLAEKIAKVDAKPSITQGDNLFERLV